MVVFGGLGLVGCGSGDAPPPSPSPLTATTTTTTTKKATYSCHSNLTLGPVNSTLKKGLCLDDTTFSSCAGEIPALWPNTQDRVTSLRLFAPWKASWPEDAREDAWNSLKEYVDANDAKILLGCEITCNLTDDAIVWNWTKQLITKLGSHRIMGLAIGNEMDLLWMKTGNYKPSSECLARLWSQTDPNSMVQTFLSRIDELDKSVPGFKEVPVTTVWSTYCYAAEPFIDNPQQVTCKSFFQKAIEQFGTRFVFSFNIYPYFDPSNHIDAGTTDKCKESLSGKLCFNDASCFTNRIATTGRLKMRSLVSSMDRNKSEKYKLWVGESGWSYPMSSTTQAQMKACPQWGSKETFLTNYNGWLSWDLKLSPDPTIEHADHVFFFTMRDSLNFGEQEHFGLVAKCGDTECKLQSSGAIDRQISDSEEDNVII